MPDEVVRANARILSSAAAADLRQAWLDLDAAGDRLQAACAHYTLCRGLAAAAARACVTTDEASALRRPDPVTWPLAKPAP